MTLAYLLYGVIGYFAIGVIFGRFIGGFFLQGIDKETMKAFRIKLEQMDGTAGDKIRQRWGYMDNETIAYVVRASAWFMWLPMLLVRLYQIAVDPFIKDE